MADNKEKPGFKKMYAWPRIKTRLVESIPVTQQPSTLSIRPDLLPTMDKLMMLEQVGSHSLKVSRLGNLGTTIPDLTGKIWTLRQDKLSMRQ